MSCIHAVDQKIEEEEIRAQQFMTELNDELNRRKNIEMIASWQYASNITDENEKIKNEVAFDNAKFTKVGQMIINFLLKCSDHKSQLVKQKNKKEKKTSYCAYLYSCCGRVEHMCSTSMQWATIYRSSTVALSFFSISISWSKDQNDIFKRWQTETKNASSNVSHYRKKNEFKKKEDIKPVEPEIIYF